MERYITGTTIKALREKSNMTQAQLGEILGVTTRQCPNGRQPKACRILL